MEIKSLTTKITITVEDKAATADIDEQAARALADAHLVTLYGWLRTYDVERLDSNYDKAIFEYTR